MKIMLTNLTLKINLKKVVLIKLDNERRERKRGNKREKERKINDGKEIYQHLWILDRKLSKNKYNILK